eukprot:GSA25T00014324001.1
MQSYLRDRLDEFHQDSNFLEPLRTASQHWEDPPRLCDFAPDLIRSKSGEIFENRRRGLFVQLQRLSLSGPGLGSAARAVVVP